jgi:hypothetical protein
MSLPGAGSSTSRWGEATEEPAREGGHPTKNSKTQRCPAPRDLTTGWNSEKVTVNGRADIMKIRFFPVAITAIASLTLLARSAEITTPNAPATGAAPVHLSSGAADILKLARAKVNDTVTLAFIQSSGRRYDLTANEIVYLRTEGVSDQVLAAMLSQPAASAPQPPPPAAPVEEQSASAPQYVTEPASTTYVETAPASTVYLATTPSYYTFADPWPYWSYWYPYPYFSFGFYWGNWNYCGWNNGYCYNGYWNNGYCNNGYWNNYAYNRNPPTTTGNRPPPPNRNAPPGVRTGRSAAAGTLAATGSTPNTTRSTSYWSNNGGRPTAARTSTSQPTSAVASQTARPAIGGNSAISRTASARPSVNRGATQLTRGGYSTRTAVSQNATSAARPSSVNARSSTVQYRPSSQLTYRAAAGPSASYQRSSSFAPNYSYRSTGSSAGFSRPSMSASYGGMGNSGGFRGGGSAGAAPRMSSGGGASRGGGGGGRSR